MSVTHCFFSLPFICISLIFISVGRPPVRTASSKSLILNCFDALKLIRQIPSFKLAVLANCCLATKLASSRFALSLALTVGRELGLAIAVFSRGSSAELASCEVIR